MAGHRELKSRMAPTCGDGLGWKKQNQLVMLLLAQMIPPLRRLEEWSPEHQQPQPEQHLRFALSPLKLESCGIKGENFTINTRKPVP